MLTWILFVVGFVILIKGADLLVDGASSVAAKYRVSPLVIGLTIVAFGTSAPEFAVNIFASFQGNTGIAIGNILGSNIANVLLILGVASVIYPLTAQKNTVWKEIPFSLLAALVLGLLVGDALIDGEASAGLSRSDGLVLLSFFGIFLYYTFGISKVTGSDEDVEVKQRPVGLSVAFILAGLTGLVFGGKWIVDGAVKIASGFGVSEAVIGLTVVAIGTSLPELATSAIAAYKRQSDIAIGNVVGSNIFNIFWILGCSSVIKPLPFSRSSEVDIAMTILASVLLFGLLFVGRRHTISRPEGVTMLVVYIGYVVYLVVYGQPGA